MGSGQLRPAELAQHAIARPQKLQKTGINTNYPRDKKTAKGAAICVSVSRVVNVCRYFVGVQEIICLLISADPICPDPIYLSLKNCPPHTFSLKLQARGGQHRHWHVRKCADAI